jgi:hypothetical protein
MMKFVVDSAQVKNGDYHITGISCEGTIVVGGEFLKVYRNPIQKTVEGEYEFLGKEDIRDIKLTVKEIRAYGHSLEELPTGMTGEIVLAGEQGLSFDKSHTLDTE